jgi:hypothetical protein
MVGFGGTYFPEQAAGNNKGRAKEVGLESGTENK